MATTQRDYYEILGIVRGADEASIKRAFRRLARELHPDVSTAPDAEERFKEVVEAYEVLSKPETRQLYDRYGHAGLQSGGFRASRFDFGNLSDLFSAFFGDDLFGVDARPATARGADVLATVEIDLVEAAAGVRRDVPFPIAVACNRCGGDGSEPGSSISTCPACDGSGRLQQVTRSAFGDFVRTSGCGRCGGSGRIVEQPCEQCEGAGRVVEQRTLEVEIPAGIHDTQRIRLSGEGHAGEAGGRAGDLYVEVRIRPDERFVREGNDIFSAVDLTMTQAALGTTIAVPTLDGEVELRFEPGTQAGAVQVLRGRGMPVLQGFGRGDQRVLVNVIVPRHLSAEQRELLEQFERVADDDTYERDEGFLRKLKSAFR